MNAIIDHIIDKINAAAGEPDFVDVVFGSHKEEALNGRSVILYGAGSLGQELCVALNNCGIYPVCFCDSNESKHGSSLCGIPIRGVEEIRKSHSDALIVIASKAHSGSISSFLVDKGFLEERLLCTDPDEKTKMAFLYSISITQLYVSELKSSSNNESALEILRRDQQKIVDAYNLFHDQKSRELLLAKLAFIASGWNFYLFSKFIELFSEPFAQFGYDNHNAQTEDYYYFNNDFIKLAQNEVYVDVGAFDGDTVHTFIETCEKSGLEYASVFAFEPDPINYEALLRNTRAYRNVSCWQLGLWSESRTLQFRSSGKSAHDQAAAISQTGDMEIQVVSLDDFLQGREVTFIKMDPGVNVIPAAIKGAAGAIAKYKPKLAIGAYHSVESIYEIPLLVKSICPDYRLYLRHNSYHPCDTDLFAIV